MLPTIDATSCDWCSVHDVKQMEILKLFNLICWFKDINHDYFSKTFNGIIILLHFRIYSENWPIPYSVERLSLGLSSNNKLRK